MKNKLFHLFIFVFLSQISMMAQSLETHLWENRVILLFTPNFQNSDLQKQIRLLEKNQAGIKERKLVVYQITPDGVKKNRKYFFEKKTHFIFHLLNQN